MKLVSLRRHLVGIAAGVALLAGCSSSSTTPSVGYANAQYRAVLVKHPLAHSWMHKLPKDIKDLVWASDVDYGTVDVISYPGGTLIGQVAGFSFPYGLCSDKNGNVYVADFSLEEGFEIAAGTTKIINSWPTDGETIGCSVSNTGDVAFTDSYPSGVWVFPGGAASGTFYAGPAYDAIAGYDPRGNLFLVCYNASPCDNPRLAELPAGGSSWIFLNFSGTLSVGGVQNMDKYLGIGTASSTQSAVDLVKIAGSNASLVKAIPLYGSGCGSYMSSSSSWGLVSKQPNGVVTKHIKGLIAANLFCYPSPINVYKAKGGDPITSFLPVPYQYDFGVTVTKP
jgi:hypothetical protein